MGRLCLNQVLFLYLFTPGQLQPKSSATTAVRVDSEKLRQVKRRGDREGKRGGKVV